MVEKKIADKILNCIVNCILRYVYLPTTVNHPRQQQQLLISFPFFFFISSVPLCTYIHAEPTNIKKPQFKWRKEELSQSADPMNIRTDAIIVFVMQEVECSAPTLMIVRTQD